MHGMKKWSWVPYAVSFGLCAGVLAGGWLWLNGFEEKPGITIRAPYDLPEQGLPVFAQFTVTQRINLEKPLETVRLEVPVYWPRESEWLKVDLLEEGELKQRWRVRPPAEDDIVETELPLAAPLKLEGEIELAFSGEHVTHENKHKAPRIFIETADYVFPNGNYRIAENEKEGDVALAVVSRWKKIEEWLTWSQVNRFLALGQMLSGLAGMLLMWSLPSVLKIRSGRLLKSA